MIAVGVTVAVGAGVTITVGVAVAVAVAVGVAVTVAVGIAVTVAVGVGMADAVAGTDVDGAAVEVGDVLGAGVVGARVAAEVTCPEFAPVAWFAQPVTATPPAASRPASNAIACGRASRRRSDRPLRLPGWTRAGWEAGASLADIAVPVVPSMSGHPASAEVTGPDNSPGPGPIRPGSPGLSSCHITIPSLPE